MEAAPSRTLLAHARPLLAGIVTGGLSSTPVAGRRTVFLAALVVTGALAATPARADGLLDPNRIARGYTATNGAHLAWLPSTSLGPLHAPRASSPAPSLGLELDPVGPAPLAPPASFAPNTAPEQAPKVFEEATQFEARGLGLGENLTRLQDALLPVGIGAHAVGDDLEALFAGLEDVDGRGRTFRAKNGRVLGDLSVSVGAGATRAGVADWWVGVATLGDLNPFRDLSAQLDIAVLTADTSGTAPLVVLRLRATYLGAFDGAGGAGGVTWGEEGASEFGVSIGLKF